MVEGHKISKKVEADKFLEHIQEYEQENIEITKHTFFHFSDEQRKIYNESWVKEMFFNEIPILVGIQNNGLWALFYKYEKKIFRFIVDMQPDKIYIVTLYIIDETEIP